VEQHAQGVVVGGHGSLVLGKGFQSLVYGFIGHKVSPFLSENSIPQGKSFVNRVPHN
jgi:hypothetical protein